MERNCDKIKRLEADNKFWQHQANIKNKECEQLRAERDKHDGGTKEYAMLVDSIIINCVVQFGDETDRGYVLSLPKFGVQHCLEAFRLKVTGESEDEYIYEAIEVAKVKEAANGGTE